MTVKLTLERVRLSFPSLFEKAKFNGVETKFGATFLIPKANKKMVKTIRDAITAKINESELNIPESMWCLRDGDEQERYSTMNVFTLKANTVRPPVTVNRDLSQVRKEDGVIYAGCFVNAVIDFWIQNNNFGKRVNANLYAVQFNADGERFDSFDFNPGDFLKNLDPSTGDNVEEGL